MDVTYGAKSGQSVRHIVLSANVTIREMSLVDRVQIKPGVTVQVRARQAADGAPVSRAIIVGENGRPPRPEMARPADSPGRQPHRKRQGVKWPAGGLVS
jgi:hypothetical protein